MRAAVVNIGEITPRTRALRNIPVQIANGAQDFDVLRVLASTRRPDLANDAPFGNPRSQPAGHPVDVG